MPALGNLDPLVDRLLMRIMIDQRQREKKEYAIERNFVRLVDKAVRAYGAARTSLIGQIEDRDLLERAISTDPPGELIPRTGPMLGFTDQFEDCITTTNRLLDLLDGLKAEGILVNREARRSIEAFSNGIGNLRNTIEHIASAIAKGEFQEGQLIMVGATVDGSAAALGANRIAFADLRVVLLRLHEIASALLAVPMGFAKATVRN